MPTYAPEAIHRAKRPNFNTDGWTIFPNGTVVPPGLKAVDTTVSTVLADDPAPVAGVATALAITTGGTGLTDGSPKAVATTATQGSGTGLTVDLTVAGGIVTAATVAAGGSGYATGDTVNVTGYAGVVLTVTV